MQLSKYNASGNDFIICHTFVKRDRSKLAVKLCDRHSGIGADGLVVLVPHDKYDFEWEFYNSDGTAAEMCGNASRATAHYAYRNGLAGEKMAFLTVAGVIEARVEDNFVLSDLTPPQYMRDKIVEGGKEWVLLDTGVPHLVSFRDGIETFDLEEARRLRRKYNANVNICTVKGGQLHVRTYERGVEDETQACGTGMAACFVEGLKQKLLAEKITAVPKSKERLLLQKCGETIRFGGEVCHCFNTNYEDFR